MSTQQLKVQITMPTAAPQHRPTLSTISRRVSVICLTAACLVQAVSAPASAQQEWRIGLYEPGTAPKPQTTAKFTEYRIGLYANTVTVPNLRGLTWTQATAKLAQLNLVAEKIKSAARNTDQVFNQRIPAGRKVPAGTTIALDLVTKVPNVTGLTLTQAYDKLEQEHGIKMSYNKELSGDLQVTHQRPEAGSIIRRGHTVTALCQVRIPKLVGMTVGEAKKALNQAHLQAALETSSYEDSDRVLSQTTAGKLVPALSQVDLRSGVRVPNLIGQSGAQADRTLRRAGINGKPSVRVIPTRNSLLHGRVVVDRQAIRPGNYIARTGTLRVSLVRYAYQPPVIIGTVIGPVNGGGNHGGQGGGKPQCCPDCGRPNCVCNQGGGGLGGGGLGG